MAFQQLSAARVTRLKRQFSTVCHGPQLARRVQQASMSRPHSKKACPSKFGSASSIHRSASHRIRLVVAANSAASASPSESSQDGFISRQGAKLKALITPFSDPSVNSRLLALCMAQALCSVATLIHDTYLPIYLQDVLGLSNSKTGNLYAVAQFLSNFCKSWSGVLADIFSPAKMVVLGTLLTTLNKPMFALSGSVYALLGTSATLYWVTAGKVFDRMSKGIREAPSKALMGDLARESGDRVEAAFALRQAMATFGALIGATVAGLAFKFSGQNYISTFALSAVPALIAFILITSAFGTKATDKLKEEAAGKSAAEEQVDEMVKLGPMGKAKAFVGALGPAYWQALVVISLLYFARFDAAFITLRAKTIMERSQLPLLVSIMMVTQAITTAPFGVRAKRSLADRNAVLLMGFAAMIAADAAFAFIPTVQGMMLGSLFVGLHMAMTHGISLAMIASYIPPTVVPGLGKMSGTVWSFTDLVLGVILAYSNSLAGTLSDITTRQGAGNIGCFLGGAGATVLAGAALIVFSRWFDLGKDEAVLTIRKPKKA